MRRNSRLRAMPTRPGGAHIQAPLESGPVFELAIDFEGLVEAQWKLPFVKEAADSEERERLTQNVKGLLSEVVTSLKDWSGTGDSALPNGMIDRLERLVAVNEQAQARIRSIELVSKLVDEGINEAITRNDDKDKMRQTLSQTKDKLSRLWSEGQVQNKLIQESIDKIDHCLTELDGPAAPRRTPAAARTPEKSGKE